jgi:hypothetical protein
MVRRPSGGTTITAAILVTLLAVVMAVNVATYVLILFEGRAFTPLAMVDDIVFILIGLAIIASAVLLWMRLPISRLIGIVSQGALIVFALVSVFLHPVSDAVDVGLGLVIILAPVIAALVLLCVPSTGRYLAARRRPPTMPPPMQPGPGYPPQGPPSQW